MSYYYKGVNIKNIIQNNNAIISEANTLSNDFPDFPQYNTTSGNLMRVVNPIGYRLNGTDLRSELDLDAKRSDYITSTTGVSIPTGCKHVHVIAVGGGGGGGGHGGTQISIQAEPGTKTAIGQGGSGGNGGFGLHSSEKMSVGGALTIDVTVGTGGARGEKGTSPEGLRYHAVNQKSTSRKANDGTAGGTGGQSYITIAGTDSNIGYGGSGGNGGIGGTAYSNAGSANASNGASGNNGNSNKSSDTTLYPDNTRNGGVGGKVVTINSGNNGNSGQNGFVRVIWLFE